WEVNGLAWAGLASVLVALHYDGPAVGPIATSAAIFSLHQAIWAPYALYRDMREKAEPGAFDLDFHPSTAFELIAAPLQLKNLLHPVVLIPLAADVAVAGFLLAQTGPGSPKAIVLIMNLGLGLFASWDAGITEEGMFRGFMYEEMKGPLRLWGARVVNAVLF